MAPVFVFPVLLLALFAHAPTTSAAEMEPIARAALKETTITLSCPRKLDKTEDEVMQWLKGRDVIFEDEGMVMSEKWNSEKFDLSVDSSSSYNLTINTLSMSDKDSYSCMLWNMDSDEKSLLAEFDVVVLEKPECEVSGGSNQLVRGQSYDFKCQSNVNDVTLLWSVSEEGKDGENSIGKNLIGIDDNSDVNYKTVKTLVADATLQGESVVCELQHPKWNVLDGKLKCSVGELVVLNAVEIKCDEDRQKDDAIYCIVKQRGSADPLVESQIKWLVQGQESETAKTIDGSMIEALADNSGFGVTLKTDKSGEMHALMVGDEIGPWQKMPVKAGGGGSGSDGGKSGGRQQSGSATGMIIVIVVIVVLLVAIAVLVVLWKRKVIFTASKNKESVGDAEKGAPKLNGVVYNNGVNNAGDQKTLLHDKDNSNVDEKKEPKSSSSSERRSSSASSEDGKKLIIDSDSGKTKGSDDGI